MSDKNISIKVTFANLVKSEFANFALTQLLVEIGVSEKECANYINKLYANVSKETLDEIVKLTFEKCCEVEGEA